MSCPFPTPGRATTIRWIVGGTILLGSVTSAAAGVVTFLSHPIGVETLAGVAALFFGTLFATAVVQVLSED